MSEKRASREMSLRPVLEKNFKKILLYNEIVFIFTPLIL